MSYSNINRSTDYFNTKLYQGNGSTQSITGVGFQPDWVWLKQRANDVSNRNHMLFDSVRGTQKALSSNTTGAEDPSTSYLTSYDSDGFTVGASSILNRNTTTYASWNWKANGAGSTNYDGSITSTVSANTTAGFSIVSYTGTGANATVGHGLGVAPSMYIVKNRDDNDSWGVYHKSLGATKYLRLQGNDAGATSSVWWNDTEPTSSVFSVGTAVATNSSTENLIAYCFAEKKGYSKFGSYTGNGNDDGTFVYTGFKPAWIIIKESSHSGNAWHIRDIKRSPINVVDDSLYANANNTETTNNSALTTDFLSNGFKLRNTDTNNNASGRTYIYMAFAENPFVANDSGTAVPVVAR